MSEAYVAPATMLEAIQRMIDDGDADPIGTARMNWPGLFDEPSAALPSETSGVERFAAIMNGQDAAEVWRARAFQLADELDALAKPAPEPAGGGVREALVAARNTLRDIERARASYGATGFPVGLYSPDPASWMESRAEAAADAADAALSSPASPLAEAWVAYTKAGAFVMHLTSAEAVNKAKADGLIVRAVSAEVEALPAGNAALAKPLWRTPMTDPKDSAAVGVEDVAAFLKLRDEMVTDPDERTDEERAESARAILDLFAPILAEKERLADAKARALEYADTQFNRALAAEAALAGERERFDAMVRAYEARALEDERSRLEAAAPLSARETMRYLEVEGKLAEINAAAIRAQGE